MSLIPTSSSPCAAHAHDAWARAAGGAALAALLILAWRRCHARHSLRRSARSPRTPQAVQTWEAEGGRPTAPGHDASPPATPAASGPGRAAGA